MFKKNIIGFLVLPLLVVVCLSYFSCVRGEDPWNPDVICGQSPCFQGPFEPPWIDAYEAGIYLEWREMKTHDNRVLETENHLIFSDASSDEAKIRMGETAEAALALIKNLFDITSRDLGIVDTHSKIQVYSARRPANDDPRAGYYGYIMWAYDTYHVGIEESWILETVEHECTHVVQFKLGGLYERVPAWFGEGLAEYISDGGIYRVIRCWPEVDEWRQEQGHVNPITIRNLNQIPDYDTIDAQRREEYYPIFGVAVRYLVDVNGQGRTLIDIKNMFADIGNGLDFDTAFEIHMGLTRQYYQNNFYRLIQALLPAVCED